MFNGKRILVVVPARCGSKGVKLKNVQEVAGRPLVTLVGDVISQMPEIDAAIVSTDCAEVAEAAKQGGLDVPFMRPESLSGDIISDLQVLTHALMEMENKHRQQYDIICMLQPTCPFRKVGHVRSCIEMLFRDDYDAVWTVSETDSKAHPLKQLKVSKSGEMDYYDREGAKIIARQQLTPLYHRNGAAYAITRDCLINKKSIKGDYSGAVIIRDPLVNIDTVQDLEYCDFLSTLKR